MIFPLVTLIGGMLAGVIMWGGFNWAMELTNTEEFCISCHVMRTNVYEEYQKTIHYNNRTGVRATCPDCHVPKEWNHKVIRKIRATNELFHWMAGTIDTREKFKAHRPALAKKVWKGMKETNSRECRNCHAMEFMDVKQQGSRASEIHKLARKWEMTCIECHKGIAHSLPEDYDREGLWDELHERFETEEIKCQKCHEDMAKAPKGEKW